MGSEAAGGLGGQAVGPAAGVQAVGGVLSGDPRHAGRVLGGAGLGS